MLRATGLVQTYTTLADCSPAAAGLFNSLEDIEPLLLLSPATLSPGPSCECEVSTSSFVLTGFFEEVPSPNSVGSLSGWLREPKKSHLGSGHCLLLRHEQWAMIHHDAAQKNHLSTLLLCLLSFAADSVSPAAFRLSLLLQPIRGTDVTKKKKEPSGHTGRAVKRQRT